EPQQATESLIRVVRKRPSQLPNLLAHQIMESGWMKPMQAAQALIQLMDEMNASGIPPELPQFLSLIAVRLQRKDASRLCGQAAEMLIRGKGYKLFEGLSALAVHMETTEVCRMAEVLIRTFDNTHAHV